MILLLISEYFLILPLPISQLLPVIAAEADANDTPLVWP
jgi:hypothetical protein